MRQYPFPETKWNKLLFGAFLFAMLLLARDTLITSVILGFTKSQVLMLGLICVAGFLFLIYNRREWKHIVTDKRMVLVVVSAMVLLLPMLAKQDWQMMYFSILICLLFAVFLTYFTTLQETAKYYVVILSLLGVYSLITMYLLKPLARAEILSIPLVYNSEGYKFFNFGLSFVVRSMSWHRNFGIFREPGVYQFFVLLGLYLNNYTVSWQKMWQLWLVNVVLAAVMLSTFAIGGFAEMGLLALFVYFDKKWYKEKWGKILGISAVLLGAAAVAYVLYRVLFTPFENTIFYEFYDMFLRLTTKSNSLVDRGDAISTNIAMFLENPLVGKPLAQVLHGTNHNTSSTLILYAVLGVAGGSLHVLSWAALTWKKERNLIGNLFLLVILFLSFNTQNLVADVFFWLFPYMALVERGLPLLKIPAKKV